MSEIPFHSTRMGQRFYEHTMPELVTELARINASLAELINVLDLLDPTEHRGGDVRRPDEPQTED